MLRRNVKNFCRIAVFLLLFPLTLSFTACSTVKDDAAFLKNMKKGLEARWKLSDQMDEKTYSSDSDYRNDLLNCINAEIKVLGEYTDYTFSDSNLEELARHYFEAVNSQLNGYKYYGVDNTKYEESFSQPYYRRAEIVYLLCEDYSFSVGDTYANTLADFVVTGEVYHQVRLAVSSLEQHVSDLVIEHTGSNQYSFSVTNTSDLNFDYAELVVKGYNENGINTTTGNGYLNNWNSGDTVSDTLWIEGEFVTATAQLVVYYNSQRYTFTPVEIDVCDNLVINISVPSTPISVSYSVGNTVIGCQISDITYEVKDWYDGKASLYIYLSGEKIFDGYDDSYSRSCKIGWKLYDESDAVVDSGNCYSSDCRVGEQFKNAEIYLYNLIPGNYRLEILNVA